MTQDSLLFIGDSGESLSHRRYFNWNFSLKKSKKSLQYVERYGIINFGRETSRRVGIGRRGRLKICCWQQRMGSSPIAGILMREKGWDFWWNQRSQLFSFCRGESTTVPQTWRKEFTCFRLVNGPAPWHYCHGLFSDTIEFIVGRYETAKRIYRHSMRDGNSRLTIGRKSIHFSHSREWKKAYRTVF